MTTQQTEMADRVRSYIEHQAAKEPAALKGVVQKGQEQLLGMLDGVSEDQATFKPSQDDWSVIEVLQHAVPAKRWTARLCAALARGETLEPGDRNAEFASLADARSDLEAAHEELVAFIEGLSPDANTEARYKHFLFGDLNCREWAAFQRVHDGDHGGQIEEVKAADGYPA